ncbi:hypothetical protein Gotur_006970, partial [Gossypium turneri]
MKKPLHLIKNLNKNQYTTSMLTSNIKNLIINKKNPKDIKNLGVKPNTHH